LDILVNTSKEDSTMANWNRLLVVLDQIFGFPNRQSSKVKKLRQGYDNQTDEHVIWLEYRVRLANRPMKSTVQRIGNEQHRSNLLQQLMDQIKRLERTGG